MHTGVPQAPRKVRCRVPDLGVVLPGSPVSAAACKQAMQSSTSFVPMWPGRDSMESSPKPVEPRKLTRSTLKPTVTRKAYPVKKEVG